MIAITGGAGFIGSGLVWKLNGMGLTDILVVDQDAERSAKWSNVKKLRFEDYLESADFLARLESGKFDGKIEAVFHMGACSDTTEMDREYLRRNNTEYTQRVAMWCVKKNAYLSYASSAATYGDGELGFSDDDALTPSLKPLNPYGQSKLDFDIWALKHGLEKKITGFRFFNVYGPNEYHKGGMRSLAQKGFEQIQATGQLKLFKSYRSEYPDGGQKRDFIYLKDTLDAMAWFFENRSRTGIYNLGTGRAQSWNDLANGLFEACGKPRRIEYIDMPDSIKNQYQYFTEADLKKLRAAGCPTRFRPVEEGVADYVRLHLLKADPHL